MIWAHKPLDHIKVVIQGGHRGDTVPAQQEGSWLKSLQGSFCVELACPQYAYVGSLWVSAIDWLILVNDTSFE